MPTSKVKKGLLGEQAVETELNKLPMKEYYLFYDTMLRHKNGKTAQIDFIVASRYGIFIIEVKNYRGRISKSKFKSYITQTTEKGEYLYPNPLNQNKWHESALQSVLGSEKGIFSVVVFAGATSVQLGEGCIQLNQLVPYILSYQREVFTKD